VLYNPTAYLVTSLSPDKSTCYFFPARGAFRYAGMDVTSLQRWVCALEGFTGQPLTTTQPPKTTKSSNLTTKTPQNEEKEYIFVIYALTLITEQILRVFWKV
jgi:hypothetical protein